LIPAGPGLGLEFTVHGLGAAGQPDEPVPLHRRLPGNGLLGLGSLLIDAAQDPPGAVSFVLVADHLVPAAAEDERQARGLDCFWFASLTIPASAATMTSGRVPSR